MHKLFTGPVDMHIAIVYCTRNAACVGRTLARACNLNGGSLITTEE